MQRIGRAITINEASIYRPRNSQEPSVSLQLSPSRKLESPGIRFLCRRVLLSNEPSSPPWDIAFINRSRIITISRWRKLTSFNPTRALLLSLFFLLLLPRPLVIPAGMYSCKAARLKTSLIASALLTQGWTQGHFFQSVSRKFISQLEIRPFHTIPRSHFFNWNKNSFSLLFFSFSQAYEGTRFHRFHDFAGYVFH